MQSRTRKAVGEFFGLNSSMMSMLLMVILIGMGEKMAERFLPLYILAIGGTTAIAGFLNGMDNLISAFYSFFGGYVTDRIGYKRALMLFTVIALFGYLIVILIPTWQAVLVGALFFIAWTAVSLPAIMSMVSKVVKKEKRTMGVSMHSMIKRIPMALGPVAGGILILQFGMTLGIRIAFITAFILGIASLILQYYYIEDDPDEPARDTKQQGFSWNNLRQPAQIALIITAIGLMFYYAITSSNINMIGIAAAITATVGIIGYTLQKRAAAKCGKAFGVAHTISCVRAGVANYRWELLLLLIADILVRFAEQIPYAFIGIWVVKLNGYTEAQFGLLTAIEMVTAMLIYIPVAYLADKYSKKPFVVITFAFFTVFPLMLFFAKTFWVLVIAFIIRGLKEFGEPTRKALIMDLAPDGEKAKTFGLYYLIRDVIVSVAAFGSAYLWNISPQANLMTAFAFGILGTLVFAFFGRDISAELK